MSKKKSTEIATRRPQNSLDAYLSSSLADRMQFAQALARANGILPKGLLSEVAYPNERTGAVEKQAEPGKVLAVLEYGASLGMAPMSALMNVQFIEGKPSLPSAVMVGLLRLRDYEVDFEEAGSVATGDYSCTAILTTPKGKVYRSSYTPQKALQAQLMDSYRPNADGVWEVRARSRQDGKLNWETITETMCQWRAASDVARKGASEVFLGAVYTPDELRREEPVYDEGELPATTAAAARDWAAEIRATETLAEYRKLKEEALAAGLGGELNALFAEHVGNLQARRSQPPTEAYAAPAEPEAEVYEKAERADDDQPVAADDEYEGAAGVL